MGNFCLKFKGDLKKQGNVKKGPLDNIMYKLSNKKQLKIHHGK